MKSKLLFNLSRFIISIIGIAILMVYCLPLLGGILNAGNAAGIIVGGTVLLVGVLLKEVVWLIKRVCAKRIGRAVVTIMIVVIIVVSALFGITYKSVYDYAQYTATDQTTVIVLGCKVNGSTPSLMLKWRCNVAADYLLDHPDAVAILSGGQGNNEDISEAQCMYNVITDLGVAPDRLYIEDASTSTDENILFSKQIIDDNNLSTDVAIATSDYHEKRASIIAKKNGLTSSSIPAYGDKYSRITFYTREVFGVWVQYLKS